MTWPAWTWPWTAQGAWTADDVQPLVRQTVEESREVIDALAKGASAPMFPSPRCIVCGEEVSVTSSAMAIVLCDDGSTFHLACLGGSR